MQSPTAPSAVASRGSAKWPIVLIAGCASTALALFGSAWLESATKGDVYIMGWFADGILPIGALLIGLVAASGYAIAAWIVGVRINGWLLAGIALITFLAYVTSNYLDFRSHGPLVDQAGNPVGFFQYFDLTTRAMHFKKDTSSSNSSGGPDSNSDDQPGLGAWGYGLRGLELLGFMGGTLMLPLGLRGKRYCNECQQYYHQRKLATIPASVPVKSGSFRLSKQSVKLDGDHIVAGQAASATVDLLKHAIATSDARSFHTIMAGLQDGTKAAGKLPRRIELLWSRCPKCGKTIFQPTVVTGLNAKSIKRQVLETITIDKPLADMLEPGGLPADA